MNDDKGIDKFAKIADEIAVDVSEISNGDLKTVSGTKNFQACQGLLLHVCPAVKHSNLVTLVIGTFTSKIFLMVPILILKLAARRLQMVKT